MSTTEEATVNPDGSTTFEDGFNQTAGEGSEGEPFTVPPEEVVKGSDPTLIIVCGLLLIAVIYAIYWFQTKKSSDEDDFFSELDGEKFNLKLPEAVDEYYKVKAKCEAAGWKAGVRPATPQEAQNGPHKVMAQALMKRSIADIPIVTHIQKESTGMNKLYSQSMCSVKQWRAYQAAEAMVQAEVEEVRAEADAIEPGWSQVIWRQAMQYHNMLKKRHEMESAAAAEQARKKKAVEDKVSAAKKKLTDAEEAEKAAERAAKEKIVAAERAAKELIEMEEREKAKKSFSGVKKGFLNAKKK